ncbi:DUF2790 domain-containing protein [Pseudomonas sp. X10]
MRTSLITGLSAIFGILLSSQVMATDASLASAHKVQGNVVDYRYGMDLDIARVLSRSKVPNVCEVVPAEMTYEDSDGVRHTLRYRIMGNGCQN